MVERPGLAFADVNFSCNAGNPTLKLRSKSRAAINATKPELVLNGITCLLTN